MAVFTSGESAIDLAMRRAEDYACERSAPEGVPGGKVESGERPKETLIRELDEELGIAVKEECLAPLTFASHAYESFHLLMPLYVCRRWQGVPQAHWHAALKWVRPLQLADYPMPPADVPLVAMLRDYL